MKVGKVGKPAIQTQTPLGPPLTGGMVERSTVTCELESETTKSGITAPPLSRGGREGLDFVPYNKKLTALARKNRQTPTAAESKLWNQLLRMHNFSVYKFTRQKPIANYIVDFYCAALHLVIEVDGDSHAEAVNYDAERTQILGTLGITVLRYANEDVLKNFSGVYDDLMRQIALLNHGNSIQ